jgi:CubicO group peptidase (beta-lactamase class C family)
MKERKRFLLALLCLPTLVFCQPATLTEKEQKVDVKAQLIKKYFNAKQMDSLYALMSPSFTKMVTKQALEQGILTQLAPYGIIMDYTFSGSRNGISKYKTKLFAGLELQTMVGIDSTGLVSTFAMQPWRDEAAPKRKSLYTDNPMQSAIDSAVDRAARSYIMDSITAGLSISFHWKGQDYFYNYGEADKANNIYPTKATEYEIGSITKTFTGYLLAKAIAEKKVNLSDPITKYLPDSVAANEALQKIQMVHLANHTSGLPRLPLDLYNNPGIKQDDPYAHYNEALLYRGLSQIKPVKKPGEQYEYSNYAMGILGTILARIYKTTFPKLVEIQMINPMKLANTTAANQLPQGMAQGYNDKGKPVQNWTFDALAACGSMKSNATDLLQYGKIMMKSFPEKNTISMLLTTPTWYNPPQVVTLGWHRTPDESGPIVYQHGGGTYGFRSQLSVCPEKKWVIVTLANHGVDPGASGVAAGLAEQLKKMN